MTNTKNIVAVAFLILALAVFVVVSKTPYFATGSVLPSGEYIATTTSGLPTGHQVVAGNRVATLGSVVIASSSATTFTIWNATSTTDTASTSLFTFDVGAAEGTYTFDISLKRGLVVEEPSGFDGEYVITFRSQ